MKVQLLFVSDCPDAAQPAREFTLDSLSNRLEVMHLRYRVLLQETSGCTVQLLPRKKGLNFH